MTQIWGSKGHEIITNWGLDKLYSLVKIVLVSRCSQNVSDVISSDLFNLKFSWFIFIFLFQTAFCQGALILFYFLNNEFD